VTRYLCAAAHLNPTFRGRVIKALLEEDVRAIGESGGADLLAVLYHALNANRRRLLRDGALAALLVPAALFLLSEHYVAAGLVYLVAWGLVAYEAWFARYRVVARTLLAAQPDPYRVAFTVPEDLERRSEDVAAARDSNVIVSGGFSPFAGSGYPIGGWSFALNVEKPKADARPGSAPEPFGVADLYARVAADVEALGLEGVSIADKLYVSGADVRHEPALLPDRFRRPRTRVAPDEVASLIEHPTAVVRHYRSIRADLWQGELILTLFLRFAKVGRSLFAEASYSILPPLATSFHELDAIHPTPPLGRRLELTVTTAFSTIVLWLVAPFTVASAALGPYRRWRRQRVARRLISENPLFDYGATQTLRESATAPDYRRYFQKLDREFYLKMIETQVLNSILEFLDAKNVDTSDLRERRTTILNSGVWIGTGTLQAENVTVGEKSRTVIGGRFGRGASAGSANAVSQAA
jgi:hypothetical protein